MKKIGLALGAGSAKGFAHLGVLRALKENNIPIDMVCGSSIGAIVGGIFSAGTDTERLIKFIKVMDIKGQLDVSNVISSGGLLKGDKIENLIRMFTHNLNFGETPVPFKCVAVNINTGKLKVFEEGNIARAVRASMSIPGVFAPVSIDGEVYVDGSVIERVPCAALRDAGMDVVIGVDVGYQGEGFMSKPTHYYSALTRSFDIMMWEVTKRKTNEADVLIQPKVQYIDGYFNLDYLDQEVEEGYRVGIKAIPEIKKRLVDIY